MPTDLILGTAGHIDHGKTSLIKALTGIDTDRLPEEKRRGITIDLGFAHLEVGDYRLGIVDVPGHERFVRNMLAGATGMDLALLVVAADDSIKPQTIEHLEILRLLELPAGVIALTKCDLVEPAWLELVRDEVRGLVSDTFLSHAPLVPTSVVTGSGLDELRVQLAKAAHIAATHRHEPLRAPFRMAIDRVFTVAGHGTVVTGSVSSGQASVGNELVIEPGAISVRVRGLQNHDQAVDQVHRGQRAAINLAGVHHEQVRRGHELAAPGHLRPSRRMSVELRLAETVERPLKSRTRVRIHLGAAEFLARVRLLDRDHLLPGEAALAQVVLDQPAVAVWRQPLVMRSESPVMTIGGGIVLDPDAPQLRRASAEDMQHMQKLLSEDPAARAASAWYFAGMRSFEPHDLVCAAGVERFDNVYRELVARGTILEIPVSPVRVRRLHHRVVEQLSERIEAALVRLHQQHPLRLGFDKTQFLSGFRYLDAAVLDVAIERLREAGKVRGNRDSLGLTSQGPRLSHNEELLLRQIIDWYREAGLETPGVSEIQSRATKSQASVPQLVRLACDSGELVQVAEDYYLHRDVDEQTRKMLSEKLRRHPGMALSEIRDLLKTTRKYAVPYCEYLDRSGFTRRVGDLRVLKS